MNNLTITIKTGENQFYTFHETDNTIEGFALNRATDSDITQIQADIQSGEVNLQFSNLYNEFNVNSETAKYKDIKNGQELVVYRDEEKQSPIFTGFIVDFSAPTHIDTQSVSVRACDRLHFILNSNTNGLQIDRNIKLYDYIYALLSLYNVEREDVVIDEKIENLELNYTVLNRREMAEQLKELCRAVDCYCYVSADNKIIFKSKQINGEPVITYTRQDRNHYLTDSEFGFSLFSSYNQLRVGYTACNVSDVQNVLKIGDLVVKSGENTFNSYDLGISNFYELDNVKCSSNNNTTISSISYTASTLSFVLNNPAEEDDIVNVEIWGKVIESAGAYIEKDLNVETVQSLTVDSILIQKKADAEKLLDLLYERATQKMPYILANVEDKDLSVDIGDIVRIQDTDADLDYLGYIHTIDAEYDGQGWGLLQLGVRCLVLGGGVDGQL